MRHIGKKICEREKAGGKAVREAAGADKREVSERWVRVRLLLWVRVRWWEQWEQWDRWGMKASSWRGHKNGNNTWSVAVTPQRTIVLQWWEIGTAEGNTQNFPSSSSEVIIEWVTLNRAPMAWIRLMSTNNKQWGTCLMSRIMNSRWAPPLGWAHRGRVVRWQSLTISPQVRSNTHKIHNTVTSLHSSSTPSFFSASTITAHCWEYLHWSSVTPNVTFSSQPEGRGHS